MARNRLRDRNALLVAMRLAISSDADARTQVNMARHLGIGSRTLARRLSELNIDWPPFENWSELIAAAQRNAVQPAEPAVARSAASWLITYQVTKRRFVVAVTVEEAVARLREDVGDDITVLAIQRS